MKEKIRGIRNTLDFFLLLGYAEISPKIDEIKKYARDLIFLAKNPIKVYELYRQETVFCNMDSWERRDYEIKWLREENFLD